MALALQAAPGFDAKKIVDMFEEPVQAEYVELTQWMGIRHEGATEKDLPRVLLIGDSIVGNYNGKVKELLKGKAYISTLTTASSFGSPLFDLELELALKHFDYGVNDLFALLMAQENKEALFIDSVHYNKAGADTLAAQVAMCIEKNLK